MSVEDFRAAQAAAMDGETRRRHLASQAPGLGSLLPLDQPVNGPGVGISDVPGLEVKGEGYTVTAPLSAAQAASYGAQQPVYAAGEVGGLGYPDAIAEPALRHVSNLGADGLFTEGRADGGDPAVVVSPPSRPSLLSRVLGRLRVKR